MSKGKILDEEALLALTASGIPRYMRGSIINYVEFGIPVGSFLECLITNDLKGTLQHADDNNITKLKEYVMWFYANAPSGCWGSEEQVATWRKARAEESKDEES